MIVEIVRLGAVAVATAERALEKDTPARAIMAASTWFAYAALDAVQGDEDGMVDCLRRGVDALRDVSECVRRAGVRS